MVSHNCSSPTLEKKSFSVIVESTADSASNSATSSSRVLDFMSSDVSKLLVSPCHIRIIQYSVEPDSTTGLNQVGMVVKRNRAIQGNIHRGWKLAKIVVVSIKFGSPVHGFRKCIRIVWREIEFFRSFEVDHSDFVQMN